MHLIWHEKNQVDITFTNIFGKSCLNSQFSFTSLYIAHTKQIAKKLLPLRQNDLKQRTRFVLMAVSQYQDAVETICQSHQF